MSRCARGLTPSGFRGFRMIGKILMGWCTEWLGGGRWCHASWTSGMGMGIWSAGFSCAINFCWKICATTLQPHWKVPAIGINQLWSSHPYTVKQSRNRFLYQNGCKEIIVLVYKSAQCLNVVCACVYRNILKKQHGYISSMTSHLKRKSVQKRLQIWQLWHISQSRY